MNRKNRGLFLAELLILVSVLVIPPMSITASEATLIIRPNSAGYFTKWSQYPSTLANWQCVDEDVPNNDTDYVYWTPAPSRSDSYNLEDHTTETGNISNVRVVIYAKLNATGDDQIVMLLVIAGTAYSRPDTTFTLNTTYAQYASGWATNPATGANWTWSDIDALEAGFKCEKVGPVSPEQRVTQLYVEVTYTPPVVHDVAIVSVTPSAATVHVGETVNITVVAKNEGGATENFTVTAYYDNTTIETKPVYDLAPGANITLTFSWNTTDVPPSTYTIKAEASVVPGETVEDQADNIFIDGTVTLIKTPVASFVYSPIAPAVDENVTFNASASTADGGELIDPDSYFWDFGDGTNTTGKIVIHAFAAEGTYNVTLTVTDTEGLSDSTWQLIKVYLHDINITKVIATPTEVIIGDNVAINVDILNEGTTSETFNVSVYYDATLIETKTGIFLGVGANTTVSFTWTTTVNGTFTISAKVPPVPGEKPEDQFDNTFTDGIVWVKKGPIASFVYSPIAPAVDENVTFNASASTADGGELIDPDSYFWDFGDGTNTTGKIVNHTYTSAGNFTVILNVTDTEELSATATTDVTILGYPVADFTYFPPRPQIDETVTFNASLSTPDGGELTDPGSYAWDFDSDGEIDKYGMIVNWTYTTHGTYTVTLNVTDTEGLWNITSTAIKVYAPPVASFDYSPKPPVVGENVTFNASASIDPDGYIANMTFYFGDDTNVTLSTEPWIINHTYTASGTYNVTLVVTDNDTKTDTTYKIITVGAPPVANFTWYPEVPLVSDEVTCTDTSTPDGGVIVTYDWSLTGPATWISPNGYNNRTFHCDAAGTVNVTLTVTDSEGLSDSTWALITIYAPPVANFTVSPAEPYYAPVTLTFNASSSTPDGGYLTDPGSYFWDFGDGTNATGMIVGHTYTLAGNYNVTLNVTDSEGLSDSTWKSVIVNTLSVAVTNVVPSFSEAFHTWGAPYYDIYVNVTVMNNGTVPINCTVTAYYDGYPIGTLPVTNLPSGNEATLTFNWNLTNVPDNATYTIKANATLLDGVDANPDNNEKVDGQVKVRLWGDVTGDDMVDIGDVLMVKLAYSEIIEEPFADVTGEGVVDIGDVLLVKLAYSGLL